MTAFFSVMNPSLAFMAAPISTILYDAVRVIETNWDAWIHAIEKGYLPDIPDLGDFKPYLQAYVKPNSDRANQLREIEKGKEGWLKKVWPSLAIIRVTLSGSYSMPLSKTLKLRHHFGPTVNLQSVIYAATETMVGYGYDANDINLYRLDSDEHIELLDVEKERSIENLSQPWEVEPGRKYEVVVTNKDGLWRYMLEDIVQVAGFSPADGQPLIRYIERKGVAFRAAGEFLTQSFLQEAITSISNTLGGVLEFSIELDERKLPYLQGDLGSNSGSALTQLKEKMLTHGDYKKYTDAGYIGDPTVRIVAPGTFKAYRDWKIKNTGFTPGQIKVPCTIVDAETSEWLIERVVMELTLEPMI
ncbi:GH3 auxin-responsive promoter [Flammula alnicola]|nr:GH3 auxin-responsive promoter [Flammula alnicola]